MGRAQNSTLDPWRNQTVTNSERRDIAGNHHGGLAVLVLVEFQRIDTVIADIVTLGLLIPRDPNLEAIQQLIRIIASNIIDLHVHRPNMILGPINEVPRSSRKGEGRNRQTHDNCQNPTNDYPLHVRILSKRPGE
jgi:hypothetical protein